MRAGGKHNDLDNVGHTARHLTFFEMLGNFSFGDYFKEDAIKYAWELLTKDFGLSPEKLLVTVYAEDDDAFGLWKKIAGLPESKIIRIPTSDNFWSMGDTGPCGPCSEIFYDHGDRFRAARRVRRTKTATVSSRSGISSSCNTSNSRAGAAKALPRPSIDTGMGLERFATVLQGVHNVFDTDLFRHLIMASVEFSGAPAEGDNAASHRVIADHLALVVVPHRRWRAAVE